MSDPGFSSTFRAVVDVFFAMISRFLDAFQLPRGPARPYGLCTVPYEYWMVTEIAQGKDYIRYETSKVPVPVLYECSPRIRGLRTRPGATSTVCI